MMMKKETGAHAALPEFKTPSRPSAPRPTPSTLALPLALIAALLALATPHASAQRVGPPPPVSYDNKYEVYGGLSYMDFKAGEDLTHRMSLGGAELQGTWWITPQWGAVAEYRGEAGTTQVGPNAAFLGIHRPLVFMNMALFGAEYRWLKNQHAALSPHAYGGISYGVFDDGTAGATTQGNTQLGTPAQNAQAVGLYSNHAAPLFALGANLDFNRSKNWALRVSPDLILEHFGNEEREFFSISGGILYRLPSAPQKRK